MKNLRRNFHRFCLQSRDKGIPNLMLYIALGNAVVTLFSLFNSGNVLHSLLSFDKNQILNGQIWRLFTYVFTQSGGSILGLIFIYFFYMIGRHVEMTMGTFKFNLFYLSGIILMDVFAMIFCPIIPNTPINEEQFQFFMATVPTYQNMAYYLHLSLILSFATLNPNTQFLIFFIIPIKGWVISLIYLILVFADIFNLSYPVFYFPHNLFPLISLANYLLFIGKDIMNLFPFRYRIRRHQNRTAPTGRPIPFRKQAQASASDYTHKCTICGRTDKTNPELEFRYCSRCNGYHCYCQEHINNHEHIL